MKTDPKIIVCAALVILIGALACWLVEMPTEKPIAAATLAPKLAAMPAPEPPEPPAAGPVILPVGIIGQMDHPTIAPTIELETGKLPWEEQIEKVLAQSSTDAAKARALFGMQPNLPPAAWERATREAVERASDQDYNMVVLPLLINPQANGEVLGILFADLMERRPEPIQLPALLAVARMNAHPFAEPAHDNLTHSLGQDFDTDWAAWEAAIRQHLAAGKAGTQ